MLLQVAGERRHAGQLTLDFGGVGAGGAGMLAVVEGTASLILWEVLAGIYDDLGLDRLGDGTFRALVLARVIEPASKLDTVRVLTEIGVASPHRVTFMRCLKRVVEREHRDLLVVGSSRRGPAGRRRRFGRRAHRVRRRRACCSAWERSWRWWLSESSSQPSSVARRTR